MKKSYLIIFALLFSCAENGHQNYSAKKRYHLTNNQVQRVASRYGRVLRPSESISLNNISLNDDDEYERDDIVLRTTDDITDDNGDYKGTFKIGDPYKIFGVNYVPQNYDDFEEIGVASWYGDDFNGKLTANGEIYNMDTLTAAHRTLPLPSLVRVTNLDNGKTVVVRVNDRGPYAKDRIIDLSKKAATMLDFKKTGTTEVKIQLLRSDTDELLKKLRIKN